MVQFGKTCHPLALLSVIAMLLASVASFGWGMFAGIPWSLARVPPPPPPGPRPLGLDRFGGGPLRLGPL
ncbi:hypothetical protein PTTG_28265 [Puccinia triticina 1-1 BBBD Race 1]|uniref:Uncharacterized protein n=2 Tax=Puccinia triticina TaxID=208348 RepID=A0A180GD15_PUCT1|nr:uncharacterized protein PtA15_7A73 [Puccinia triticina]OAV90585.1 hypothetical protein PTTG_28265 [Puccinia triticina 1-1 BBBD Race 1]WAQ86347.1 hypothetical protein PtA15_7A73 [Puccinia triticina]